MRHVLVVDDEAKNLYMLETLLTSNGFQVSTTDTAASALELARGNPPDLVVSDILMPGTDGYAFCRQWKTDPALQHIPFVFYSAVFDSEDDRRLALDIGAADFIEKPIGVEQLVQRLSAVLDANEKRNGGDAAVLDEKEYLRNYSRVLNQKLEAKVAELERANSDLQRRLDELNQAQSELRIRGRALDSASNGITISLADHDQQLVYCNRAFEEMTGYSAAEVLGTNCRFLSGDDRSQPALEIVREALRDCKSCQVTLRNYRKDGSMFWNRLTISPVTGPNGQASHFIGVQEDITDQVEADETLRDKQRELNHIGRLSFMGEMVAGIAHEVKQPLAVIMNYASAARNLLSQEGDCDPATALDYLAKISEATVSASDIIRGLRGFAERSPGERELRCVDELIRDSIELVRFETRSRSVRVIFDADMSLPDVLVNPVQIQQVVVNLIHNACDSMSDVPLEQREITLTVHADDQFLRTSVADLGSGIPSGVALFEPFNTTKESGLGMGLAISRTIIEDHGGAISAAPNQPCGTIFSFTLPLVDAPKAAPQQVVS